MKILNFGSCNIDYVYRLEHMVRAGETLSAEKMEIFPGGKGLNQSIALARAGARVYHAGCIGSDGGFLKEILAESGADVSFLKQEAIKNGHAIIQVDDRGENSIFIYKGSNGTIGAPFIDQVLEHFEAGDFLLLQNEISDLPYLIRRAADKGMRIVWNPAPFTEELRQIDLMDIECLILNEVEAQGFLPGRDESAFLEEMNRRWPELKIVLTVGKRGAVYAADQKRISCPAFQVTAVDTTAAGDTFTGYFLAGLATGASPAIALKTASAAAALAVSKMGAAPSIPVMAEVRLALERLRPYNNENQSKKEKLRRQIESYLDGDLRTASLKALAQQLGYSEAYVGHLIRETMGVSFSALLQERRCRLAARLLEQTDLSVQEIITQAGYENESFFRRKFKALYGVTPLKFRKEKENKQ